MKRYAIVFVVLTVGVVASMGVLVGIGRSAPSAPPVDVGPTVPQDVGMGEELLLVVGGVYPTRAEALAANAAMVFGDVQGYYVVPLAQFQGFREQVGTPGEFALVSTFRTQEGADAFVEITRLFGHPATLLPERVRSLGGVYAGLGQEAHPDGSGPLLGPIDESLP